MRAPVRIPKSKMATVFIDLQEEHRRDARYLVADFDAILSKCAALQAAARENEVAIFHVAYLVDTDKEALRPFFPVMADGTPAFSAQGGGLTDLCPEVGPVGDEPVFFKSRASAFASAALTDQLKANGIEWIFIAGVWSEACIDASVKDAIEAGFHVILVKDACGSGTAAMHQVAILNLANRLYGGAIATTADACRVLSGEEVALWQVEGSVPLRYTQENLKDIYDEL